MKSAVVKKLFKQVVPVVLSVFVLLLAGCGGKSSSSADGKDSTFDIAVFVPGVTAGSPMYEQMVSGVKKAAAENSRITVKILEAGFNQGEWEEKLMSLAAENRYELIVSDNGAMPYVALPVAKAFPSQKFLFVDAVMSPNDQMYTFLYNQLEEAFLMGYLGGLITKSGMKGANADLKIGIIAGQEYPAMTSMIIPGYRKGAEAAGKGISVDFRVLGNWYDANKANELAESMIDNGVDVILPICGGANQGVITAAKEHGIYVLYFDSEAYDLAPGVVAGCVVLEQERAVYELVMKAFRGELDWGGSRIVGVKDGYIRFADDNENYSSTVSSDVRDKMASMVESLKKGEISLKVPRYWEK